MKKNDDAFYHGKKWKRIRGLVLRRDNYQDQLEKRYGRLKEATIVHHILPREYFPMYEYETWNLISVSKGTHNKLHDRDTDELTDLGIELVERTCRKNHIDIPKRYHILKLEKKYFK